MKKIETKQKSRFARAASPWHSKMLSVHYISYLKREPRIPRLGKALFIERQVNGCNYDIDVVFAVCRAPFIKGFRVGAERNEAFASI